MSGADWVGLFGVFLGGAVPILEAVIVIPGGIVAGLDPIATVVAGVTGNLITLAVSAWFGERLRAWWWARRGPDRDEQSGKAAAKRARRGARIERIMRRGGMLALAFLGPLGLGTHLSVLVAVGLRTPARTAFLWVSGGTIVWSVVAAYAAVTGLTITGVG